MRTKTNTQYKLKEEVFYGVSNYNQMRINKKIQVKPTKTK